MAKKLFEVEVKITVVVVGDDESDAYVGARKDLYVIRDEEDFEVEVIRPLAGEALPSNWDGMCVPYGGDGNTRIKDYPGCAG